MPSHKLGRTTEDIRRELSALLRELIRLVRESDGLFLTLEVRESNLPARRLYERFGFREAGRRRQFYSDPREDALLLTLSF